MIQRTSQTRTYYQGSTEKIVYRVITPTGTSPSNATMKVIRTDTGADVTSTVTTGTITISTDTISLKKIQTLTAGLQYRVTVEYDSAGNHLEGWFEVYCDF